VFCDSPQRRINCHLELQLVSSANVTVGHSSASASASSQSEGEKHLLCMHVELQFHSLRFNENLRYEGLIENEPPPSAQKKKKIK